MSNEFDNNIIDEAVIGQAAPDFSATAVVNNEFKDIKLSDYKGKFVVLFFYPLDFTFVCPTELGDLADNYEDFQKLGVDIYGVSTDSHWTHKAWHKSSDVVSKVQYTLISDDQFKLSKQFKVLRKGEGRADRGTFIVDPNGVIQAYEITSEGIGRDAQDLLRKVKAAQYVYANPDEVCPAKWQEGEDTLTPSLDLSGKI